MTRIMDAAAVAEIRREMDKARTAKNARQALARAALRRTNLTSCGRSEWEKELG